MINKININHINLNGELTQDDIIDLSTGKIKSELIPDGGGLSKIYYMSISAATTPIGVTWTTASGSVITGTMVANSTTKLKAYFVPTDSSAYDEYVTLEDTTTTPYTYSWGRVSSGSVDIDKMGFAYEANMSLSPLVDFLDNAPVTVTVKMNLSPLKEDSSTIYSNPEYTEVMNPPYVINGTTTFYGRLRKGSTNVDYKMTTVLCNKIFYGFGDSAEEVKSTGVFYPTPVTNSVGISISDMCGATAKKFYILIPGDVQAPTYFLMNGIACQMTATEKTIDGIFYKIYESVAIEANKQIKLTLN